MRLSDVNYVQPGGELDPQERGWPDTARDTRRHFLARPPRVAPLTSALATTMAWTEEASAKQVQEGATHFNEHAPLVLRKQGTFYVGGSIEFRDPNTSSTTADPRSLPGYIAVDQIYVEYQIPARQTFPYPIVFMHGGGHTGEFWRTTPDGREGWFTSFTRRGFSVYSVDGANRDRAGWDPTNRNRFGVSQGILPYTALESASMYSEQSARTAFRWGPAFGAPYPNTQFPARPRRCYLKEIRPAYRDANENPYLQANRQARAT